MSTVVEGLIKGLEKVTKALNRIAVAIEDQSEKKQACIFCGKASVYKFKGSDLCKTCYDSNTSEELEEIRSKK